MSGGVRMLMAALLVAVFLGACATPSGRTPGQVIDDSSIATQINVKLLSMPGVRVLGIDVDVHQGEVILSGRAHTESEEMRIVDAVRAVDGVRKVTSLLKIIP
ncbi:MAG: BON domain-containing protein [Deltaproteobacteria bacterium]|nr:BON domain-containing protein [Candidatus Anaeroferrophillacea bacterium]